MRPHTNQSSGPAGRSLALAAILAALVALPATRPAGAEEAGQADPQSVPARATSDEGTCPADGSGDPATSGSKRDTVEATRPGPWRGDAKLAPPRERIPGTPSIAPKERLSTDAATAARWVRGYRPATAEAQAEFEAWKQAQAATLGTAGPAGIPSTPASNYAANLLRGTRVEFVPDEPITHTVHGARYQVSSIDLRQVKPGDEPHAKREGKPESESIYDHHSGLTWDEYRWVKRQAESAPPTLEAQDAGGPSPLAPTPAGVGFDAIASGGSGMVPPDPIMAAGPGHLVAIVNQRYRVWNKSGVPLVADITMDQFFAGVPHCTSVFDVFVDYDEAANRFVMGGETVESTSGTDSYLCVAATATNDPTGVWHRTSFRSDSVQPATWLDYPHMGIGLDAIYISGNMFVDGGNIDSIRIFAVDKDALYQGAAVSVAEAGLGGLFFTAQPAKIHGYTSGGWPAPGTPHLYIAHDGAGNSRIWRWSDPFATPPVIYGTFPEAAFNGVPPSAPELGSLPGNYNDTGSGRWYDAEYRGGKLWATRNTACNIGGGNAESCIDWIQVDVSGPAPVLEQQQSGGAFGSADDFRYYPDLSVDRNGNIAIGYTKSSLATHTQIWVTGREFSDPPGTLQSETLQRAGLGNYTDGVGCGGGCDRWGDYTGMTVDPDGCTFWYLGQYSDGGYSNWGTHIGSFRFDSCSTDALVQMDKGTYTCNDSLTVTVTDSLAIDAETVSASTTVTTTGGDSETIPPGSWTGSDCAGQACTTWNATLPVSGAPGSADDGMVNVHDAETITTHYADPHAGHGERSVDAAVNCRPRLEDGGYLTAGGCEGGQGGEVYRDYMDGGEYIAYTFGIYNPPTSADLTDVVAELVVTGPAAGKVTVYDPVRQIGSLARGQLTAPVFALYIDPSIDTPELRMSLTDFNLYVTSAADGLTVPLVITQRHLLQADDNIVGESQCFNLEAGSEGFVEQKVYYQYNCSPFDCGTLTQISTVEAPWTRGPGCGSETRSDDPRIACDAAGTNAFKSNADPAACTLFPQTRSGNFGTILDTALYSPVFGPVHTGLAANGQPWNFEWLSATWYFRSDMVALADPAMGVGFFWDPDYPGVATPGTNEIYDYYPFTYGYFYYPDQGWDSAKPWNSTDPPANVDGIGFGNARGLATAGLKWRWAVEVYDADMGADPLATEATQGLALDNLSLAYNQYHADGQVGSCGDPAAVVSFDRFSYLQCPSQPLRISVLDGAASGAVLVTVLSETTGDSETFSLYGAGPTFGGTLPSSTAGGPRANDGTLLVAPSDRLRVTYNAGFGSSPQSFAYVDCQGGDVIVDGYAGVTDNGDHDSYGDTNETVNLSLRIRNNTGQPLQNVVAIIDTDDPSVDCISKSSASFGTIAAGGTGINSVAADPFTFKVAGSVACTDPMAPPTATFRVLILADGFAGPLEPQEVSLLLDVDDVPGAVTYLEPFTTNPTGFVHQLGPGDDDGAAANPSGFPCSPYADRFFWRGSGGNSGGGYFCWKNPEENFPLGDLGDLSDSVLYSPVFKIDATGTTLSFDHEYLFGYSGAYRADGARVDYRVNGGVWRKLTTLPYDGGLIFNTYCNPLCNTGGELGDACFSEIPGLGEMVFNQLDQGARNWTSVSGALSGLSPGDQVQFRWRVGSMRSSAYGISTKGGYGLDNVGLTSVVQRTCDAAPRADVGCGVVFERFGNLAQLCGDGDALVEPTERWAVDVTLRNSTAAPAVNTVADLLPSGGSLNPASVSGNPGSFGTLAAAGGTGTARYEFVIGQGATCIENVLFDVRNIATGQSPYADQPGAFSIPVGGIGARQTATQATSPLVAEDSLASSPLLPALTVPVPAYGATLGYTYDYTNVAPVQAEVQVTDPLNATNASATSLLGAPFTISPSTAVSAVVDWTTLNHANVTTCTKVYLRTPKGFNWTLKDFGEAVAKPYDVLSIYRHVNGGAGQYRVGLQESTSGSCGGQATLRGTAMTVTDRTPSGNWTANAQVSLWNGASGFVIKRFGAADTGPYDVKAIYDAAGPGTYEVRVEENDGGGRASISSATLEVTGIQCDQGCGTAPTPAPPVADGKVGTPVRFGRGAGPNEVAVTIDNATCSSNQAVVLYGTLGNFNGYQGAVTGCNIGTGPAASFTAPPGNVWFNVIWVNDAGAAGSPGSSSTGPRTWSAAGLCGVIDDDTSDPVCD